MNKPVSGSTYRKFGIPIEELRVRAQNNPNMTVRVNEGSYYTARMKLVEFEGGTSPVIQAPATGYKWVVVGITSQGTIFVSSGEIKNRLPELPNIEKNMLPLAAIYLGANSTAITEDMIEDIRPFIASGYYPGDHAVLDNCDQPNLHPISAITDLQATLDDKATKADLERFSEKIDEIASTSSAVFTLNSAQSGVPTVSSGIIVNRGSELAVGIRYNERKNGGLWEFTNDGIIWNELPTALSIDGSLKKASASTDGVLRLSIEPENALLPIAVGDNDPRLTKIDAKANAEDVYLKNEIDEKLTNVVYLNEVYMRDAIDNMLDGKVNVGECYSEAQIDALLRGKLNVGDAYTKAEEDNFLIQKADKTDVYTQIEINEKLDTKADKSDSYIKSEIDDFINIKANADNVYSKAEIDDTIITLNGKLTDLNNRYDAYVILNNEKVDAKAEAQDTYTKAEIDENITTLTQVVNDNKSLLDDYIENNDVKVNAKAESSDVYNKAVIDMLLSAKANDNDLDKLESDVATLSTSVNKTLTDVAASIVTQTEYQKDFKANQDIFQKFNIDLANFSQDLLNTQDEVTLKANQEYVNEQLLLKANASDVYTKEEVMSMLEVKADSENVYSKDNTYSAEMIQELLALKMNKSDVYSIEQSDSLLSEKASLDITNELAVSLQNTKNQHANDKADMETAIAAKANKDEVSALTLRVEALEAVEAYDDTDIKNTLATKADVNQVYTQSQVDALLSNMYTKEEVDTAIEQAISNVLEQIRDEINSGN